MKLGNLIRSIDFVELLNIDNYDEDVKGISYYSKKTKAGDIFICLTGEHVDGHEFAEDALENGAIACIVERRLSIDAPQIVVNSTVETIATISDIFYSSPSQKINVIGVTGTNGKTSVTYMLKSVLESCGHKTGVIGTIQHLIGDEVVSSSNTTPGVFELHSLFASMVKAGCEYVVMEVSSHSLAQRRVEGINFSAAIFTNLTQDHLDYHGNMENYFAAKKKLFSKTDLAVINIDDAYGKRIAEDVNCKLVTYSALSDNSTFSAKNIKYRPDGVDYDLVGFGTIGRMHLKIAGKFSVYNSMGAAVCATELGMPIKSVTEAVSSLDGVRGRAEVVPCNRDFTVIIDYAHTPDGLQNILNTFKECPKNRLIVLFGCGGDRDKTKRPKMAAVAARLADFVIVTSDNPRTEEPLKIIDDILVGLKGIPTPYKVIENRISAIKYAVKKAKKGDIIILAGKGHETYQILGTEKIHLDEREIVAEALAEL